VILPGGESTAMLRIMKDEELLLPIRQEIANGLPAFGTCAGMILLAKEVENDTRERIATMDISVLRNAYGRQLGSFFVDEEFKGIGNVPMTFIRAPYITQVREGVDVLSSHDGHIIAARQGKQLVTSFHPELNEDTRIHQYFLNMIQE
jgi:5'-phosphate synthase pdxT subunit